MNVVALRRTRTFVSFPNFKSVDLQITTYLYALGCIVLNAFSVYWYLTNRKMAQKLLSINLNIADISMSIYLVLILGAHYYHAGHVEQVVFQWKCNDNCTKRIDSI